MKNRFLNTKIWLIITLFLISPVISNAQLETESGQSDVNLIIEGCNNDSVCQAIIGEDTVSCPLDCPEIVTPEPEEVEETEGVENKSNSRRVSTYPFPEIFYPTTQYPSPTNIGVVLEENNVNIFWQNPSQENFDFVRIMIKENFASNDPYDGIIIYEGSLENVSDILSEIDTKYFYTFFAKYENGIFSEGVPLEIFYQKKDILQKEFDSFEPVFTSKNISIFDFSFFQNEKDLFWQNKKLIAIPDIPVQVYLPKKSFFGPIEDVFLNAKFYTEDGVFLKQENIKFTYRPGMGRYETEITEIKEKQFVNFFIEVRENNKAKDEIRGTIKILDKGKIFEEETKAQNCFQGEKGFDMIKKIFDCYHPWPIFLSIAFILIISVFLRRLIS